MTEGEEQIVQQVVGVAVSAADMSATLVRRLVLVKALKAKDALMILIDMHAHKKDLAKRNLHLPGQATVFELIASRIQSQIDQLKKDTGAKAVLTEKLPDGSTRSREL